jgi:thiol-disulfide isomerase/thioredoxin
MRFYLIVFSILFFDPISAQVVISGTVKNYDDTVFYIKQTGVDNFTGQLRDNQVMVRLENDGYFKTTVPEKAINPWYFKTKTGIQLFDLIQGESLRVTIDFAQKTPIAAFGKYAADLNYSAFQAQAITKYPEQENIAVMRRTSNIDSALHFRIRLRTYLLSQLSRYKDSSGMTDRYYKWLCSKYKYEPYDRTLAENNHNTDSLFNSPEAVDLKRELNDDYAALNTVEYTGVVHLKVIADFIKHGKHLNLSGQFNFIANNSHFKGYTKSVLLTRVMHMAAARLPDSIYQRMFRTYDRVVQNDSLKRIVFEQRSDYLTPAAPTMINSVDAGSLSDIFEKYKGKIIYVDFWASWCAPCRAEMPNAAILKERLKGTDVVFLYLGYEDKDTPWMKARNEINIQGEHYLLNKKMIGEADKLFGISGIPHYAIIDRAGRIVVRSADRPQNVFNQLQKLVSE